MPGWFERLPNGVVGAICCVLVLGILPCNSVPMLAGWIFGWRWGVGAFLIFWGALGIYQLLPSTNRIDPRYLGQQNEKKEADDSVS